jgi:hypothetical protein
MVVVVVDTVIRVGREVPRVREGRRAGGIPARAAASRAVIVEKPDGRIRQRHAVDIMAGDASTIVADTTVAVDIRSVIMARLTAMSRRMRTGLAITDHPMLVVTTINGVIGFLTRGAIRRVISGQKAGDKIACPTKTVWIASQPLKPLSVWRRRSCRLPFGPIV